MKKRMLSVLLALCLLLSAAPPATAADQGKTDLAPLASPSNLRWISDGAWGPGEMAWDINGAFQGKLDIKIYRENDNSLVFSSPQEYDADEKGPFRSEHLVARVPYLEEGALESGDYYFTIQNIGDGKTYASSPVISSQNTPNGAGVYSYTQPADRLGETAQGRWEWPAAIWEDKRDEDSRIRTYYIEYGFSDTAGGEIKNIASTSDIKSGELDAWLQETVLGENGEGCYYFRVKPISRNIEKTQNGAFSPWSEAYNLKEANQAIQDKLTGMANKTADEIRAELKKLNQTELRNALWTDNDGNGAAGALAELEKKAGVPVKTQVSPDMKEFDSSLISIVGAGLNVTDGAGGITLNVGKPQQNNHHWNEMYDSALAVNFSMSLDNVKDPKNLDVPVKVTLPIPEKIDLDFIAVLHYKLDSWHSAAFG